MSYWRFAAMIVTSTIVMFGLMHLNTYLSTHVFFSETRIYMAVLMGAFMAIVMLAFMLSMYPGKGIKAAIFVAALAVAGASLWLVRSQATVGDASYMRAMIPHHSIAIMTSSRARIADARVRKLADEIIYAQDKEIAEMRYLIDEIGRSGLSHEGADREQSVAPIMNLDQALSTPKVATLDAGFMTDAEIARLFDPETGCTFRFTADSPPALAVGQDGESDVALVKLGGGLVRLGAEPVRDGVAAFTAQGIEVTLRAAEPSETLRPAAALGLEATMVMRLEAGLMAGYRGFYGCGA